MLDPLDILQDVVDTWKYISAKQSEEDSISGKVYAKPTLVPVGFAKDEIDLCSKKSMEDLRSLSF